MVPFTLYLLSSFILVFPASNASHFHLSEPFPSSRPPRERTDLGDESRKQGLFINLFFCRVLLVIHD